MGARLSGGVVLAGILLFSAILLAPGPRSSDPTGSVISVADDARVAVPTFRDDTLVAGITFSHLQGDEHLTGLNETLGAGACAFDYDNDGWIDLFLVNGTGQTRYYGAQHWWHLPKGNALYRNVGGGRFKEVTPEAGLAKQSWGMGCAAADLDNDGHTDLIVTNYGANLIYRNTGDGTFTDVTKDGGIAGDAWSTSVAPADYDGDGLVDIYITNYIDFRKGAHTYEGASQFMTDHPRSFFAHLYVAQSNRLYRNLGNFRFEDTTEQAGVRDASGRGLSAAWIDINDDRRADLLIANDAGTTNVVFVNQGNGRFEEAGARYRLNDARGSRGLSIGDVNADGFFDVAASTSVGEPPLLLINEPTEDRTGRVFRNRSRNLGIGTETAAAFSGWGIALQDFNNDGRLDLFQVNGLVTPDPDTHKLPQGQAKRLWLQQANGYFRDVSDDAGIALADTQSARGLVIADFDNDGDVDIYVAQNNELGQLLMNDTRGHWLGIKLEGRRSNRDAIGAIVRLQTQDGNEQYRRVDGGAFLSSSDRRLHFGLGSETRVARLSVTWPSGSTDVYRDLKADQYVHLIEGRLSAQQLSLPAVTARHQPTIALRLAPGRPANRMQYLQWAVDSQGVAGALVELRAAIRDDDSRVRTLALRLLKQQKQPDGLTLLIGMLEDADVAIRTETVDAIREYEDEASIRWLLRAFRDPDPKVRAAVADAFKFFFNKEEAIIFRKYLALPHLIRLLDDPDATVRRAAARALGAAERYRAIEPLIARIDDPDPRVRAEAVCSLGLIRDRKALDVIKTTLADAKQPPVVRAHALIAMRRLNEPHDQALEHIFSTAVKRTGEAAIRDFLETLKEIFSNTEHGVVLNRARLLQSLTRVVPADAPLGPKLKQLMVEVLQAAAGPRAIESLQRFARDPDPAVRERAYLALIEVDRTRRPHHYQRALLDPSIELRTRLFHRLATDHVVIPPDILLANLGHPQTQAAAIRALAGTSDRAAIDRLRRVILDTNESVDTRLAALESLTRSAKYTSQLPAAVYADAHPSLRAAAIRFWVAQLPVFLQAPDLPEPITRALQDPDRIVRNAAVDVLQQRHESWASRYLINALLDKNTDLGIRRRILDGLSHKNVREAEQALLRIARLRHDPLRIPAVNSLIRANSAGARELLWEILNNAAEDEDLRFVAAQGLQAGDKKAVLEKLRSG